MVCRKPALHLRMKLLCLPQQFIGFRLGMPSFMTERPCFATMRTTVTPRVFDGLAVTVAVHSSAFDNPDKLG
jgi:hypothetical protein